MRVLVTGNVNVDLIFGPLAPWPQPGTEVIVEHHQMRVGGALGNLALALHQLGVHADFAANVGNDQFGNWLHQELSENGCTLSVTAGPTAVTIGLSHPDAQRTFITYEGHFRSFDVVPLQEQVKTLKSGDLFVLCGHFLVPALLTHAYQLCQSARAFGAAVLLDTGWPPGGWDEATMKGMNELLSVCDYFLPNQEELTGLTNENDVEAGLAKLPSSLVTVVKQGAAGACYLAGHEIVTVAAPMVKVVDTVGAGDTFNAAFIYGLSQHMTWQQSIRLAIQAASLVISTYPRRYPTPTDLTVLR